MLSLPLFSSIVSVSLLLKFRVDGWYQIVLEKGEDASLQTEPLIVIM